MRAKRERISEAKKSPAELKGETEAPASVSGGESPGELCVPIKVGVWVRGETKEKVPISVLAVGNAWIQPKAFFLCRQLAGLVFSI